MKITRTAEGYRIRMTDAEFAALAWCAQAGGKVFDGMTDADRLAIRALVRKGMSTVNGADETGTGMHNWQIHRDRRP
jgi:hypothetical protein